MTASPGTASPGRSTCCRTRNAGRSFVICSAGSAGYAPHVDAYDVAILVLSGEVETLGERMRRLGIVYYSAGEAHGMRNVGSTPATHLVFEFHSPAVVAEKELARRRREARRAKKAARAARKRRRLHRLYKRIKKLMRRLG